MLESMLMLTQFFMYPLGVTVPGTVLVGEGGVVSKINSWIMMYGGNSRKVNRYFITA